MAGKNKKSEEKNYIRKKLCIIYAIIVVLALALSLTCHFLLNWNSISDFLLCFVGVSGTVASLYSIVVSVNDEIRAKKEREDSKDFFDRLSKSVGFLLSDTETVKTDLKQLLNAYSESNISTNNEDVEEKKQPDNPTVSWEKPDDENPPT